MALLLIGRPWVLDTGASRPDMGADGGSPTAPAGGLHLKRILDRFSFLKMAETEFIAQIQLI